MQVVVRLSSVKYALDVSNVWSKIMLHHSENSTAV